MATPNSHAARGELASERASHLDPKLSNGGVRLVDDGSGRLRDVRRTDSHSPECPCLHCRKLCCLHCHVPNVESGRSDRIWQGLPGFGRHIQTKHPWAFSFDAQEARTRRVARHLNELKVAKEIAKAEKRGLRKIPLAKLTEKDLENLNAWTQKKRGKSDPMLLKALEMADEGFPSKRVFDAAVRQLALEIERGQKTGKHTTSVRPTSYDPNVAVEILRLQYALHRGWSFVVHLVLLYGFQALAESLATEGLSPPNLTTAPDRTAILESATLDD